MNTKILKNKRLILKLLVNNSIIKNEFFITIMLYTRCRELNRILSTYPEYVELPMEYITFDSYLINSINYILSLEHVKVLEHFTKVHQYPSLKMSLAFVYANLSLYKKAVMLINEINCYIDPVEDFITIKWIRCLGTAFIDQQHNIISISIPRVDILCSPIPTEDIKLTKIILIRWGELLNINTNTICIYDRLCAIMVNKIENIMHLTNESTIMVLLHSEFYEHIYVTHGEFTNPHVASNILMEQRYVSFIIRRLLYETETRFGINEDFIKELHAISLDTIRMKVRHSEIMPAKIRYLINVGEYRNINIQTRNRICPSYTDVDGLMVHFVKMFNDIVMDNTEPYRIAAMIYHKFVWISPFQDGNERIGRLLANIPLLINKLPPICILDEDINIYYDAVDHMDKTSDLTKLIDLLQSSTLKSIKKVYDITN